jgi:hypothetical protein
MNEYALLQILVKRIIINQNGQVIDYELNSPFIYLRSLVDRLSDPSIEPHGSEQFRFGVLIKSRQFACFF